MSVNIGKNGVITASGIDVGENLVLNSINIGISHLESGNEYIDLNLGQSYMDITHGTKVTISFDLELKYITETNYFYVYNTNDKGPKQISGMNIGSQVFSGHTVGETIKKRVSATTIIVDRSDEIKKDDNYIEFYTIYGSGNVFKISNIKIELGDTPTPWCPNETDDIYTGTATGFVESNTATPKIAKAEYVEATEFIEW